MDESGQLAGGQAPLAGRQAAWELLCEYTQDENLRKHGLAVEAAMRHYAARLSGDPEAWGIAGLLHDFDYERWPNPPDHATKGAEILRQRGYPEEIVRAILGHADYTGVPRDTPMARALYACDELCGLTTAVALVRPSKKLADVEVKSVLKKMKEKGFARGVNREDIQKGTAELGVPLEEHVANVIEAMKGAAAALGL